ncbi:MAG: penicillin acylase family protein [Acidobacteria bacterium]|nr:penicillin acylase family protein [Acidobacteriota bacterium]
MNASSTCGIPTRVLDDVRLGKQTAVRFQQAAGDDDPPDTESNNWAILATDPHRPFSVPAFRYFAHVTAPGLNVIGLGEPQHPGFVFGHNGMIAWGQTTFAVDMEDIYVYETNAPNTNEYRYRGGPMHCGPGGWRRVERPSWGASA